MQLPPVTGSCFVAPSSEPALKETLKYQPRLPGAFGYRLDSAMVQEPIPIEHDFGYPVLFGSLADQFTDQDGFVYF
jgi:hypothetical protein